MDLRSCSLARLPVRNSTMQRFHFHKAEALSGDSSSNASAFRKCLVKQEMRRNVMSAVSRCQHLDKYEVKLRLIYQRPTFVLFLFPIFSQGRSIKDFFFLLLPPSFVLVLNSFGFIRVALARQDTTPRPHTLLCSAQRQASFSLFVFPPALRCKMDCSQLNYRNISASTYHRRAIFKSPKTNFLMSLYSTRTPNQPPEKTVCGTSWELFKRDGLDRTGFFFSFPVWSLCCNTQWTSTCPLKTVHCISEY